jgi:hypothetical protein
LASFTNILAHADITGVFETGIADHARAIRSLVQVGVECLVHVELLFGHIEELKSRCRDRFEGFGLKQNNRLELKVFLKYLVVILLFGV